MIKKSNSYAEPIPPWPTPGLWQAANEAMAAAVERHQSRLQEARSLAGQIRSRIEALDSLMHALCGQTCPSCTDNCCRRATVWFDFKDLLGFHMGLDTAAQGQLISSPDQTCRYLTSAGCIMRRTQRPFVCTWFICATQKAVVEQWPFSQQQFLWNSLEAVKKGRNRLEDVFIAAITSGP